MSDRQVVDHLLRFGAYERRQTANSTDDWSRAERFWWENPTAFLFGLIFNQGIPYQQSQTAPYRLKCRLGHLNVRRIADTPVTELRHAIRQAPALHRYIVKLPKWIKAAALKLVNDYHGRAENIWKGCLTAGEVIERLDDFPGIGQKKAHLAARLLHEDGDCGFYRWDQINMAVDVHVRRVWKRAGLVADTSIETITTTASRLHPSYPGELDLPTWLIGRTWCHERRPDCAGDYHDHRRGCPLRSVCPKVDVRGARRQPRS